MVVGIVDGDTVTILDHELHQHKIRLAGIDAPEKPQPYGQKSKTSLARLLYKTTVRVDWNKRDRYGRIIGRILVDSQDAGLVQIQEGLAWWYRAYAAEQPPKDRKVYEKVEAEARENRGGLWTDPVTHAPMGIPAPEADWTPRLTIHGHKKKFHPPFFRLSPVANLRHYSITTKENP